MALSKLDLIFNPSCVISRVIDLGVMCPSDKILQTAIQEKAGEERYTIRYSTLSLIRTPVIRKSGSTR